MKTFVIFVAFLQFLCLNVNIVFSQTIQDSTLLKQTIKEIVMRAFDLAQADPGSQFVAQLDHSGSQWVLTTYKRKCSDLWDVRLSGDSNKIILTCFTPQVKPAKKVDQAIVVEGESTVKFPRVQSNLQTFVQYHKGGLLARRRGKNKHHLKKIHTPVNLLKISCSSTYVICSSDFNVFIDDFLSSTISDIKQELKP
jgi:hypothetical protein